MTAIDDVETKIVNFVNGRLTLIYNGKINLSLDCIDVLEEIGQFPSNISTNLKSLRKIYNDMVYNNVGEQEDRDDLKRIIEKFEQCEMELQSVSDDVKRERYRRNLKKKHPFNYDGTTQKELDFE